MNVRWGWVTVMRRPPALMWLEVKGVLLVTAILDTEEMGPFVLVCHSHLVLAIRILASCIPSVCNALLMKSNRCH